jgi:3',5'-cyclic-AMP phosphodiesterase
MSRERFIISCQLPFECMDISPVPPDGQPVITVRGGFLRSLENRVAVIRGLGFETQIKIFQPDLDQHYLPITLLVENVRGYAVEVNCQGGVLANLIRAQTSVMFDVPGEAFLKICVRYSCSSEEFDFLFVGDIHGVFENLQQIITMANVLDPLFIMSNGDMTHSGRLEDYHTFADLLSTSQVPVFTALGNHDKRTRGGRATYRRLLAPFYYSFEVGNTKFIVLDSSRKRGLQKFQYAWLERELQFSQGKRIFVFLHRPPVCPKYNYLSFSSPKNIKRFLTLMEMYQVEMVFSSHIHVLSEFARGNVRYVVTGGGGGALWRPANIHHYLHVIVKKDDVEMKVIELPTPDARVGQRLKDALKFNLEFHLNKTKRLRQAVTLGTALLLSRSARLTRPYRRRR